MNSILAKQLPCIFPSILIWSWVLKIYSCFFLNYRIYPGYLILLVIFFEFFHPLKYHIHSRDKSHKVVFLHEIYWFWMRKDIGSQDLNLMRSHLLFSIKSFKNLLKIHKWGVELIAAAIFQRSQQYFYLRSSKDLNEIF